MDYKNISIATGLTIVVGTHVAMVFDVIPMNTMLDKQLHAYANLAAAALLAYSIYV
jgi:hypothetical protein